MMLCKFRKSGRIESVKVMNYMKLQHLLEPLLDLLFPERCRICNSQLVGEEEKAICRTCLADVKYLGVSVCRKCGSLIKSGGGEGFLCGECLRKPPQWDQALSVVRYGAPVSVLLHRLKYSADTTVMPALQAILKPFVDSVELDCDCIIPVPLHRKRLKKRGLNQSIYLARLLFPSAQDLISLNTLTRVRYTQPQTGLDGQQRRLNLRGAFQLTDPATVSGKKVCIIDDVYTTGTTVNECSRIVRKAGALEIKVVTLARVIIGG